MGDGYGFGRCLPPHPRRQADEGQAMPGDGSIPGVRLLSPFTSARGARAAPAPSKAAELGVMPRRVVLPLGGTRQAGGGAGRDLPTLPQGKAKSCCGGE